MVGQLERKCADLEHMDFEPYSLESDSLDCAIGTIDDLLPVHHM